MLPGDYNGNGLVDAADYAVWRKTQGQGVTIGSGADGNRNGMIDAGDYGVWRSHFGQSASGAGAAFAATAIPEPGTLALLLIGACLFGGRRITLRAWIPKS